MIIECGSFILNFVLVKVSHYKVINRYIIHIAYSVCQMLHYVSDSMFFEVHPIHCSTCRFSSGSVKKNL